VDELFIFGVRAHEVPKLREERKNLKTDPRWDAIMDDISGGMFGDPEYFQPLIDSVHNMDVSVPTEQHASSLGFYAAQRSNGIEHLDQMSRPAPPVKRIQPCSCYCAAGFIRG
jgi:starch phosphorylase